jgi:hypothetical protein
MNSNEGPSLKSVAVIGGWACFLLWINVVGCNHTFAGWRGFPVAYETWQDYGPPFGFEYPWAIPIDIGFAVVSLSLIVFFVRRWQRRPD